jgi:hypothetical protein
MRLAALAVTTCVFVQMASSDSMPVSGSVGGTFLESEIGSVSGDTWNFGNGANAGKIRFEAGPLAPGGTTEAFSLGSLTLSDSGYGGAGNGVYSANLKIDVNFTNPTAGLATFLDTLSLKLINGSQGVDLLFDSPPSAQTLPVGSNLYTLRFDGLFDAPIGGHDITAAGLRVDNAAGPWAAHVDTAYLRATVFLASVPEPDSLTLLLTGFAGLGLWRALLRGRKNASAQLQGRNE